MRRPTYGPSPQVRLLLPAPVEWADRRSAIGVSRITDGYLGYWAGSRRPAWAATSPRSLLPHWPQRAGLGRLLWPRHGLFGQVNAKNSRQNGHEPPLRWPKKRWRGQRVPGSALGPPGRVGAIDSRSLP